MRRIAVAYASPAAGPVAQALGSGRGELDLAAAARSAEADAARRFG